MDNDYNFKLVMKKLKNIEQNLRMINFNKTEQNLRDLKLLIFLFLWFIGISIIVGIILNL